MKLRFSNIVTSLLLSFAVTNVALAVDQVPTSRTITRIHSYSNFAVVRFSPDFPSTLACGGVSSLQANTVVIDFTSNKDAKTQYATVLAAFLTGKKVGFGVNSCSPFFGFGVPKIYRVDVAG